MDKIRNLNRFWVDKDTNIVVRQWTDEEYKIINPHTHIFEKYWSYYCPICGFIPMPCCDKSKVERDANHHRLCFGNKHKCIVEYRDHELACLEYKDEFMDEFGVWVFKQTTY
jgi:hypothetical protein